MSARSRCASQMTNDQFAMTNRSTKAVSHQAQVAAPILHPASPIINRTSSIIDLSTSYLRRRSPCDTSQRPLLLPLHRTIPDNSLGHFVRSVFQLFPRIKGPAACRSGQFEDQLSPRIEFVLRSAAQATCRPRVAHRPKNTPGQNATILERRRDMSAVSNPAAGQFEERMPAAFCHPPFLPPSPLQKLGEFERNLASSIKHASFRRRKLGEFDKSGESRDKS